MDVPVLGARKDDELELVFIVASVYMLAEKAADVITEDSARWEPDGRAAYPMRESRRRHRSTSIYGALAAKLLAT